MIHRSFLVPVNAKEARFTAPVAEFLGVIAGQNCFILCTICNQTPESFRSSSLVLAGGQPAPAALKDDEPLWIVEVCKEGDELPKLAPDQAPTPSAKYLGSVLTIFGPVAVYVRRG